jgi:hypothetical protein
VKKCVCFGFSLQVSYTVAVAAEPGGKGGQLTPLKFLEGSGGSRVRGGVHKKVERYKAFCCILCLFFRSNNSY